MDTSHELASPLTDLLYTIAGDGVDDETTGLEDAVWAGLLRNGADVARRLAERINTSGAGARYEIDAEEWATVRGAFGIIIRRDNRRDDGGNTVSARAFADAEVLLAEWEATKAELETAAPVEGSEMSDSTDGSSAGPASPSDDEYFQGR